MDFQLNLETEGIEQAHPAEPVCVRSEDSVRHVMRILRQCATGAAVVCQEGRAIGIFTERDAVRVLAREVDLDVPVATVMVTDPICLHNSDTVGKAIGLMSAGRFRRLPLVDEQRRPMGMVKASGILRYLVEHFPKTIYNLPPTSQPTSSDREGA